MTTADLLARILAEPDDQVSALVYADAISAADPARGELIVVEQRLANLASIDRPALLQRRAMLLAANARWWWPELAPSQVSTWGGFVRGVRVRSAADRAQLESLSAREPITQVIVCGNGTIASPVALARVRDLELQGPILDAARAAWFAALSGPLDRLAFNTASPTPAGRWEPLPVTRHLGLDGAHFYLEPLLAAVQWEELEELRIARTELTDDELGVILQPPLPKLRRIQCGGAHTRAAGLRALAVAAARYPTLEEIDIVNARYPVDTHALADLVAACGSRVTLRHKLQVPMVVPFTFANHHCELRADVPDQHRILVDGTEAALVYRTVPGGIKHSNVVTATAPLAPLARGLATGAPLTWSPKLEAVENAVVRVAPGTLYDLHYSGEEFMITRSGRGA